MGQTMSVGGAGDRISAVAHCTTCADDQKKESHDNIMHSIKLHKKGMIKGKLINHSSEKFAKNLAETLEIPDEDITDHYSFGKVIGVGQFGTVKEAFLITDKSYKVAVKILELKSIAKTFKSICGEVSSLKQADHPNIIKLLEVFMDKDKLYLVFEYVNGVDLSDYIAESIKISEDKAAIILHQIGNTIDYLHSIHIGHRDIKLDNIMVNPETLEIKLIDFGFATKGADSKVLKGKIGTPYYVAPEVITGNYGKECDMWSIGVMTYFMLSGCPPFDAESDSELFDNITTKQVIYIPKVWGKISKDGIDFVKKLLVKNPEKRMTAKQAIEHSWLTKKFSINIHDSRIGE